MQAPFYPIIYVRGFAATMSEIDQTTTDPYMGFNIGSSILRQNHQGDAIPFYFESPLIRLMKDHGYVDAFKDGGYLDDPLQDDTKTGSIIAPTKSVWVFRYYERASELLGNGQRVSMEEFALDLRRFILRVRDATCGDNPDLKANFKVHLVAHSMGSLVSRCYLQNICRHGAPKGLNDASLELEDGKPSSHYVDKLFTYGTPHNGIDFLGINVPDLEPLDRFQVSNFHWFDEHFEGFMYEEQITLAIRSESTRYGFSQRHSIGNPAHLADEKREDGRRTIKVPVGTAANARPGFQGYLEISVDDWQ